jgi:hypothetical protein
MIEVEVSLFGQFEIFLVELSIEWILWQRNDLTMGLHLRLTLHGLHDALADRWLNEDIIVIFIMSYLPMTFTFGKL